LWRVLLFLCILISALEYVLPPLYTYYFLFGPLNIEADIYFLKITIL